MADLKRTVIPMMLLGDGQVGKTSLIQRITGNKFDDNLLTTIGKESYVLDKVLHDQRIKIKIWDTAGQERFKSMSVSVIKNVEGLILTYSIINRESFNNLEAWLKQLNDATDLSKIPIVIVGNKIDLEAERQVSYEEGKNYAANKGYQFFETSAKTNKNVTEAFDDIFEKLYKKLEDEITGKKAYKVEQKLNGKKKGEKKKCC